MTCLPQTFGAFFRPFEFQRQAVSNLGTRVACLPFKSAQSGFEDGTTETSPVREAEKKFSPVVNVVKRFWDVYRFRPELKQQYYTILKVIDNSRKTALKIN